MNETEESSSSLNNTLKKPDIIGMRFLLLGYRAF